MLQQDEPDDYVLATGVAYSVRDFVERAFNEIGRTIVWQGKGLEEVGVDRETRKILVRVEQRYYRPAEVDFLTGDATKARDRLGWVPQTTFNGLVKEMIQTDLKRVPLEGPRERSKT